MKDFLTGRPAAKPAPVSQSIPPGLNNLPAFPPPPPAPLVEPPASALPAEPPAAEPPPVAAEPQLELVPDAQGRIGHIVVTCRCGEQIILQCNY